MLKGMQHRVASKKGHYNIIYSSLYINYRELELLLSSEGKLICCDEGILEVIYMA